MGMATTFKSYDDLLNAMAASPGLPYAVNDKNFEFIHHLAKRGHNKCNGTGYVGCSTAPDPDSPSMKVGYKILCTCIQSKLRAKIEAIRSRKIERIRESRD